MRFFNLTQWSLFAGLVVGLAMLGLGAAGTFLVWLQVKAKTPALRDVLVFYAISLPLSLWIWKNVPFNALEFIWDWRQLLLFGLAFLVFGLPFFLGALSVAMIFAETSQKIGFLYAADLCGAAGGAVGGLFLAHHGGAAMGVAGSACLVLFGLIAARARPVLFLLALFSAVSLCFIKIKPSPFKALAQISAYPDFKLWRQDYGPLGHVASAASEQLRFAPGLSLRFDQDLPKQTGFFVDGELVGACLSEQALLQEMGPLSGRQRQFWDWLPQALAFSSDSLERVMIAGAASSFDIWPALRPGVAYVEVVQPNKPLLNMLKDCFLKEDSASSANADRLIWQARSVRARLRLATQFDLIIFTLLQSAVSSFSGAAAGGENTIYTLEAVKETLRALSARGVAAYLAWSKYPPRDDLRIFATAAQVLKEEGLDPKKHLLWLRSWRVSLIMFGRLPWSPQQLQGWQDLSRSRAFDWVYRPGLKEEDSNYFYSFFEPVHFRAAQAVLGNEGDAFFQNYVYAVTPVTDDKPFFFDFYKLHSWRDLFRRRDPMQTHYFEWGWPLLAGVFVLSLVAGVFCIAAAWFACGRSVGPLNFKTGVFFLSLGLGFMCLEISLMSQAGILLASPLLSAGALLTVFLLGSGLGAYWSERRSWAAMRRSRAGAALTLGFGCLHTCLWPAVSLSLGSVPLFWRFLFLTLWVGCLAYGMGFLFPAGLAVLRRRGSAMVGWAWGLNGCGSVIGANMSSVLLPVLGLRATFVLGLAFYVLAFWAARGLREMEPL